MYFRKFNEIFFKFQRCTAFRQFYWDKENLNMSSHLTLYIGLCLNLGLGFTHFTCLCDRSRTITICALHCVPKLNVCSKYLHANLSKSILTKCLKSDEKNSGLRDSFSFSFRDNHTVEVL